MSRTPNRINWFSVLSFAHCRRKDAGGYRRR